MTELLFFRTPDFVLEPTIEDLKERVLAWDDAAFYLLFEKAAAAEPGAVEAFHEAITSHPSFFYRFAQLLSSPPNQEAAFGMILDPCFDLKPLASWIETEPYLCMLLIILALEYGHASAQEMISRAQFNRELYRRALEADPSYLQLTYLCLIAECGYANVKDLLTQVMRASTQELFFACAGLAVEGSLSALQALNRGATADHVARVVLFTQEYREHPIFGPLLLKLVKHPGFRPDCLSKEANGESVDLELTEALAELDNPWAQELLDLSEDLQAAAGGQQ